MANPEHVEILKQGVEVWNQWRAANPETSPDLSSADLCGARLCSANLRYASLSGANLSSADFTKADLFHADFREATLRDADFSEAILFSANFCAVDLSEVTFLHANLSNADLSNANLSRADLSGATLLSTKLIGANLSDAFLNYADLTSAYFMGANLSGAFLENANLYGANLSDANCNAANLSYVNLNHANFSRANLNSADLRHAIFDETTLIDTDWKNACLGDTIFANVNLNKVKNLETVRHSGPSFVNLQMLFSSINATVPESFWRGCGVPQEILGYLSASTNPPVQSYSVFISYTHADTAFARRLHDALQSRGIRCWLDEYESDPAGSDDPTLNWLGWGLKLWDKVLLCCSETSLQEHPSWVRKEIYTAFLKEQTIEKQRGEKVSAFLPLDLDGYLSQWDDSQAGPLRARRTVDFNGWDTDDSLFEAQCERVVKTLRTDRLRTDADSLPPLLSDEQASGVLWLTNNTLY